MGFRKIPEGDKGLGHVNSWGKRDVGRGITSTKVLACSRNNNETLALKGSGQGRLDTVGEESVRTKSAEAWQAIRRSLVFPVAEMGCYYRILAGSLIF